MEEDPEESQSNKADVLMGSALEVEEQYCIQVVAMGGASFTVDGVSASDSVRDLLARVSSLAGVPPSELRLLKGDEQLFESQSVKNAGIGSGDVLTALRVAMPRIYERSHFRTDYGHHYGGGIPNPVPQSGPGTVKARVAFFGDQCFLVSRVHDADGHSNWRQSDLTWDIMCGSFRVEGQTALCTWIMHVQRKMAEEGMGPHKTGGRLFDGSERSDSGWELMDRRASIKFSRIELTHINDAVVDKAAFDTTVERLRQVCGELNELELEQIAKSCHEKHVVVDAVHDYGTILTLEQLGELAPSWHRMGEGSEREVNESQNEWQGEALNRGGSLLALPVTDLYGETFLDLSSFPGIFGDGWSLACAVPAPESRSDFEHCSFFTLLAEKNPELRDELALRRYELRGDTW